VRSLLQRSLSTEPKETSKDLSRPEVEALFGFLLEKHPEDDTQRGHVLKSDLMDALCAQSNLQPDLTKVLAELYHDLDQNVVIRDYAVQHLALLDERLTEGVSWSSSEIETQGQLIERLLWEASAESDSSIGGTALLALMRSLKTNDQLAQERLASTALRLANDRAISPLARISAIQVCGQIQVHAALPHLCRTAEQDSNFTVRISAIGALGQIGNANTVEVLKKIAREQNPRLDAAVTVALARLGQRSP
jgi:HEAT repeat protein